MKVHVVQNRDGLLIGVFKTKRKAKKFSRKIGEKRWGETWHISTVKINEGDKDLLCGNEEYRGIK